MEPRAASFARLLHLNAGLLLNCVDGVSDERAARQVVPGVNSMSFLIAHMTDARHALLSLPGGDLPNPLRDVLANVRSIGEAWCYRRSRRCSTPGKAWTRP